MSRESTPSDPSRLDPDLQLTGAERELAAALGGLAPSAPRLGVHDIGIAHARAVALRRVRRWQAASSVLGLALAAALAWRTGPASVAPPGQTSPPPRVATIDDEPRVVAPPIDIRQAVDSAGSVDASRPSMRDASYANLRRAVLERGVSWLAMQDRGADTDESFNPDLLTFGRRSLRVPSLDRGEL